MSEARRAREGRGRANGAGSAGEFEDTWPEIKVDMLKHRTTEQETRAREDMRIGSHSRI